MSEMNKTSHNEKLPPDPLQDATMDGPISLTPENTEKAAKAMTDMIHSLQFFHEMLKSGTLYKADVKTHIGMLRYGFNDLNELLDGGQFLSEKLEETVTLLQKANRKIKLLESQSGANVTAVNGQTFIKHMEDALATWYELSGFHFGSSSINVRGITLDMSDELEHKYPDEERCDVSFGRKDIATKIAHRTPYRFSSGYDIHNDGLNMYLLDTDNNRRSLITLFTSVFPNSHISGFKSRSNRNLYMLRVNVFVPFTDIERWLNGTK